MPKKLPATFAGLRDIIPTSVRVPFSKTGQKPERSGEFDEKTKYSPIKPFILFHVNILREYLSSELYIKNLPFVWDPQRAIDDWIFLCFFVGNDFLPHIPSLDIREGALDSLVNIWKQNIREWGSYITDSGELNLTIVEQLMFKMGQVEDKAFVERRKADENRRMARLRKKKEQKMNRMEREAFRHNEQRKKLADVDYTQTLALEAFSVKRTDREENMEAAKRLKMMLQSQKKEVIAEKQTETSNVDLKRADDDSSTKNLNADSDDEAPMDSVRLWEFGWKERYYEEKFHVDISDTSFRSKYIYLN
jgi:5'-3' exoribonuclease 2